MGYTTSTVHGIEVPDSAEANNVPEDIGKVVTALEAGSLVKRLTGAQISALTSPKKPAGLLVYNTTTSRLQISDGTTFADIDAKTYAIGTRDTSLTLAAYSETTITYTAETDPSSMLNTGTGIVTLPSAGLWLVTGSAIDTNATGGISRVLLWHGTTQVAAQAINETASATAVVYAAASDTVRMGIFNDSSSKSLTVARFTAARIGV